MSKIKVGQFRGCSYGVYEVLSYLGNDKFKVMWQSVVDTRQIGRKIEKPVRKVGRTLIVTHTIIGDHKILKEIFVKDDMPRFMR
jgi:hypothetical protein